ncbi:MAG: helix-turn-helix transcriptional regulator [Chloroflexota bacterium]
MSGRSRFDLDVERRADDVRRWFGADLQRICDDAGLSHAALARAARVSADTVSRLARGKRDASVETLARISLALGAELSIRLVPGAGIPIHDAVQARMVEAFVASLHRRWVAHLEVAVRTPARGSIDLVLADRDGMDLVAAEFQSDMRRAEQAIRWSNEKAVALSTTELYRMAAAAAAEAGPPTVNRLLVLRSTATTRAIVRELPLAFQSAYPTPAVDAVAAIRGGTRWPGSAIVWMQVHGRVAHLMDGDPRELRGSRRRS